MGMWIVILVVTLIVSALALVSLVRRFSLFSCVERWSKGKKGLRLLLGAVPVLVLIIAQLLIFTFTNMMIMMIFLALFFVLADLIVFIFCRCRKVETTPKVRDLTGYVAIGLCVLYFACGWFFAHHVSETDYTIRSDKIKEPMRIVLLADAHMGTTFTEDGWYAHLNKINAASPDAVVIAGDLVDDQTTYDEMRMCCFALGGLQTKYGVYYAFGNHDKGYSGSRRGYDGLMLQSALEEYGVRVLEDQSVMLRGDVALIGRADASMGKANGGYQDGGREEIAALLQTIDPDAYTVVIDHQPNDYDAEAAAGANLVLSGHTHGGQLFPINRIGELIGANDRTYGHEKRGETDFIVTSGISAWEIPFKTGCKSEYVVIDLMPAEAGQ